MAVFINSLDDAIAFAEKPIIPYDPQYTKDIDSWRLCYDEFVHFIKECVLSNPYPRSINFLHTLYTNVIYAVETFERHRGIALIPLHVSKGSLLHSLYSADTLTPQ